MFIVTYSYKVPKAKVREYLNLQRKVKAIYLKHGCLSYEIFEKAEKDGKWMEIERFRSKSLFKKTLARVDKDPEIRESLSQFCSIINIEKNPVVTKQFVQRI